MSRLVSSSTQQCVTDGVNNPSAGLPKRLLWAPQTLTTYDSFESCQTSGPPTYLTTDCCFSTPRVLKRAPLIVADIQPQGNESNRGAEPSANCLTRRESACSRKVAHSFTMEMHPLGCRLAPTATAYAKLVANKPALTPRRDKLRRMTVGFKTSISIHLIF